jgi:NADH:ubiquinone oxidoreductase subunit H
MFEGILEILIKSAVILAFPLGALPLIIHVERRGAAFIQKRVGPNRVGPFGLLQPLADVAKFMFKEEVHPTHVRPFFYSAAPLVDSLLLLCCHLPVFQLWDQWKFLEKQFIQKYLEVTWGSFLLLPYLH